MMVAFPSLDSAVHAFDEAIEKAHESGFAAVVIHPELEADLNRFGFYTRVVSREEFYATFQKADDDPPVIARELPKPAVEFHKGKRVAQWRAERNRKGPAR